MRKVVAVFGLSGVGKSTMVERVVAAAEGLAAAVNAGELIGRRRPGQGDGLRLLSTGEIQGNQNLLVEEVAAERARPGPPVLLLDGHCVIDNGEELVPVPVGVIERLGVSAMVYVTADAGEIRARRLSDPGRKRPDLDEAELASHQATCLAVCTSYSVELGLPTIVVPVGEHGLVVTLVTYLARDGMGTTNLGCRRGVEG